MSIRPRQKLGILLITGVLAFPGYTWQIGTTSPMYKTEAVPGGVVVLKLPFTKTAPAASYNNQRVMVIPGSEKSQWFAIVGIPLDRTVGTKETVEVKTETGETMRYNFTIKPKAYRVQHIKLLDGQEGFVDLSKENIERYTRESKLIGAAFQTFSDNPRIPLLFEPPVIGRFTGSFGSQRIFNGKPRKPHNGMDIAAPIGTPVKSPGSGRVILVGDYFFNGKSVFLDHGQGLITMYCHLNSMNVNEGDQIDPGQVLGTVGKTGRATGPHLHWTVVMNRAGVNPALFIPQKYIK